MHYICQCKYFTIYDIDIGKDNSEQELKRIQEYIYTSVQLNIHIDTYIQ